MSLFTNRFKHLEVVLKHLPEALIAIDPKGRIAEWNLKAGSLFGRDKSEVLGKSIIPLLLDPKHTDWLEKELSNTPVTLTALKKDGARFLAEFKPIMIESSPLVYFLVHESRNELQNGSDLTNLLLENIPDMIFVKEAGELRFVRFNRAGEELLGYGRDQLLGKNDYDFFPKQEADFFTSNDRKVLENKTTIDIPEEPIHTLYKGTRVLHTKKVPIYDENGKPVYLLGISEDITEKKQAELARQQLVQEQLARFESERVLKLRDDFISIAAHELKTPLTSLNMQVQILVDFVKTIEHTKLPKFLELTSNTKDQIERFSRLIDDLLDVSRAGAGKLVIERKAIDLCDTIRRVVRRHQAQLMASNCRLDLMLPDSLQGYWDPSRLEQVLDNLLSNAIKYGAGKPIEIRAAQEDSIAQFTVQDHGIGIAEKDQNRIFERYERVVHTKKIAGLGLGLFITRQIVQAHGGRIYVTSSPGLGSAFTVELPLAEPTKRADT